MHMICMRILKTDTVCHTHTCAVLCHDVGIKLSDEGRTTLRRRREQQDRFPRDYI